MDDRILSDDSHTVSAESRINTVTTYLLRRLLVNVSNLRTRVPIVMKRLMMLRGVINQLQLEIIAFVIRQTSN